MLSNIIIRSTATFGGAPFRLTKCTALKNPAINDSDYNGEVEAHSTKIEYRRSQYDSDVKTKGFSALS